MKKTLKKLISWLLILVMVAGLMNTTLLPMKAQAAVTSVPNVVSAALAGSFQSELGATGDWLPASPVTEMTYYDNGIFEFVTDNIPAGSYEYKVALNDSWGTAYPSGNISITVPDGTEVIFQYNSMTNTVIDSINNPSQFIEAEVLGTLVTTADAIGWDPARTGTEMEYVGGGIYRLSTPVIAGAYEYKVALNNSFDVSYPQSNKALNVASDGSVTFYYNHNTHSVRDTLNDTFTTATVTGSLQSEVGESGDWLPGSSLTTMHDVDEDGVYMYQAFLPEAPYEYKVTINGSYNPSYPNDNKSILVPTGGSTVRFVYDHINHTVLDSINNSSNVEQRYIDFKYTRTDDDFTDVNANGDDWNLWVWGTGIQDGQINFTEFSGNTATARIPIGATNYNIGFIIRLGNWTEREGSGDGAINTTGEFVTKVTYLSESDTYHVVPTVTAPVNNAGDITFYYRDEELYRQNQMHTLAENGNGVKVSFNGAEYDMEYVAEDERFVCTIENVDYGEYEYTYLVTENGETEEINDPMNTVDGVSRIVFIMPTASITTNVSPSSIDYNESAVLSLDVSLSQGSVEAIYADLTSLGGNANTYIDPEVNAISLSVRDNVTAGTKQIPITVVDEYGNNHSETATVDVEAKVSTGNDLDFDWDEARIYFMMTDRFNNGDTSNDNPNGEDYAQNDLGAYQGGDFRGIINQLDYLNDLGINTIWITPIVDNIEYDNNPSPSATSYGYHGYWAKDFTTIDEHLGDLDTFKELIDEAHDRGMKIMVDVVLNHTGYGLRASDATAGAGISNYPTDEDRARFSNMLRTHLETGDVRNELSGLPDFLTEEPDVREQVIEWQVDWLNRAKTERGDTIDYFRIDTVRHVEDTTWRAFKNALTAIKPDFKVIGEWYGAGVSNTFGQLRSGQMDSLLDFEFNEIAEDFVEGQLEQAETYLENRDNQIDNTATLGQYLSSHDADGGFMATLLDGDTGLMKVAAALQITAKGQPVIYYGEELGLSSPSNAQNEHRYVMPWDEYNAGDETMEAFHTHYQKLLNIRAEYSKVFSKGTRTRIAGGNAQGYMVVQRSFEGKDIFVALNTSTSAVTASIDVPVANGSIYTDEYSNTDITVTSGQVTFTIPGRDQGGTAILTTTAEPVEVAPPVPEGSIRIHYSRPDGDYDNLGVWTWGDVASPSDGTTWPSGATPFNSENVDSYGAYLDIPLAENPESIGFLIVNRVTGDKDGGNDANKTFTFTSPDVNEIFIEQGSNEVYNYEPVNLPENTLRIHYVREDENYGDFGLWLWNDVVSPSSGWPSGAMSFSGNTDRYGAYIDVPLTEDAGNIGFLVVNRTNGNKDGLISDSNNANKVFSLISQYDQVWIREHDNTVYVSPYWEEATALLSAEVVSDSRILLGFTNTAGIDVNTFAGELTIVDSLSNPVTVGAVSVTSRTTAEVQADVDLEALPLSITYLGRTVSARTGWRILDEMYYYDGNDLGAVYSNGSATLKLWAPRATQVVANFYDKNDATQLIGSLPLTMGDAGVWSIVARPQDLTGVTDLRGYFYQYEVTNNGVTERVLDPYAKSMAPFTVNNSGTPGADEDNVGKAAIIDLSQTDPSDFDDGNIPGYQKREDAVVWEVHVRDFTSDPSIEGDLNARFGTYKAFIDKLPYIKSLGVTHVQLLPVLQWYYGDETAMNDRELEYSASGNEYNWGFDPHSYFSLEGAYSENAADPELRIKEFKELVDAIHEAGMGVVLDVVYTHMVRADFLEDVVPGYYFFQRPDGSFTGDFGNNLATNRKMAEKLLVDSVEYWFDEYKIDGMRFDMMGDGTGDAIQKAYDAAAAINPKTLFIGEGWRTFSGDESDPSLAGEAADQDWMDETDSVGVFSDEFRNELKAGFGSEGQPRFITGGARDINVIFNNIKGQPGNTQEDDPGDMVQYIAAHDNLTLHDAIALAIRRDPSIAEDELEIHKRMRLGDALILTSQGTAFLHAGQEYGRTKAWPLAEGVPERNGAELRNQNGELVSYLINDSVDSSDVINKFDWTKATNETLYPVNVATREYVTGLIALRKSSNAFRLGSQDLVNTHVTLIASPEINSSDVVIGYKNVSTDGTGTYYVFVNADNQSRTLSLNENLTAGTVLVDDDEAGVTGVSVQSGFSLTSGGITLDPLTAVVIKTMPAASNNNGSESSNPVDNVKTETNTSGNTTTITKTVTATTDSNGRAVASISQSQISDAISKAAVEAEKQGKGNKTAIEIKVEAATGASTVQTSIPKNAVDLLADSKANGLKVSTPVASITFDKAALSGISDEAAGDVKISATKVERSSLSEEAKQTVGDRPVFDFTVSSGDKTISQFKGNVEVSVPYTIKPGEDPKSLVIYYINDKGELEVVSNCVYDATTGTVRFKTNHFSRYAVGYNKVSFSDVPSDAWFSEAVAFIAARGITTGTGNGQYSPADPLTRGQFLTMVMRAYAIKPDENSKDNFKDAGNTYYTGYLAAAKRLGLSAGVGNNLFAPEKTISRQEMFTLLYNILKYMNDLPESTGDKGLSNFSDATAIASWAKEAMSVLAESGIIGGNGKTLNPNDKTDRAQMAQVLFKLLSR